MDIDFDDLDGPSQVPSTKASKFAPKNSKFKPVAKPKPEPGAPISSGPNPAAVFPKIEHDDSKPLQQSSPPVGSVSAKPEVKQPYDLVAASDGANGSAEMDIDGRGTEADHELQTKQDEEDQVVREIDVFFTPSFDANSKLYVMQYPLRPSWRPYELEERCEKVRLKPESAEVEVEMSVQFDPENFDPDAQDKSMTKQILSSSWKPPLTTGYAVGILMGNKLHLNPVNAVVQLRPSMQHLAGLSLKKMDTSLDDEDTIELEGRKKEKVMKPSKKQNKPGGPLDEQKGDSGEQWVPLKYHSATSEFSSQYRQRMVAQEALEIQFSMSPSDYINSLCPASEKLRPTAPSKRFLLKLPLEERYKTLLLEGSSVHRFNDLKRLAPDDSDKDVLGVLQIHAQLVQGLWVAKSKIKYGKDTGKEVLARDYVLLRFSENLVFREVEPKSADIMKLMQGVLKEFAVFRDSSKDWKFKETPDYSFAKEYPDVVEKQKENWNRIKPRIEGTISQSKSNLSVADRRPTSNNTSEVARRATNVPPSRTMISDETREALPKALQKLFQTYKVCSFNQIRQRLRDMAVSGNSGNTLRKVTPEARAAAAAADAPQEELLGIINQVAVNVHGVFVAKSSADHPQYDGLRKVVIDLLLAEPNAKLKKAAILEAAKMQLKRDIPNHEYMKVLSELCVSQNGGWVLKSGDGNPT